MVQGNYYYPLMARLKSLYGDVTGYMIVIEQQVSVYSNNDYCL